MSCLDVIRVVSVEERKNACASITSLLQEWFAQENSNKQYIEDAGQFAACGVCDGDKIVGLMVYKPVDDAVLDCRVMSVHWLGIMPAYHRRGIGESLMTFVENEACKEDIGILTVETLSPEAKDVNYLKTYAFYSAMGFEVYGIFKYDEHNPMVRLRKKLAK